MSDALACPYCNFLTPTEFNYCINCEQQVKCKHDDCKSILIAGKNKCFKCGRPTDSAVASQGQANTFSHVIEEKGIGSRNASYHQKTEFRGSDFAVAQIGDLIAAHITGQAPVRINRPTQARVVNRSNGDQNHSTGDLFEPTQPVKQLEPATETPPPPQGQASKHNTSMHEIAARYFERDGELLIKKIKDFKGKTWSVQQRRFLLLYTFAYPHLVGKLVPAKEHFKAAAEKADIADVSNFAKYVEQLVKSDLLIKSDGVTLNSDGEKNVAKILAELDDPKVDQGEAYWTRDTKQVTTRARLSNDDKARLEEWAREEIDLGELNIVQFHRAVDYALLAFWMLTVKSHKTETASWNEAYHYLNVRFPKVSASSDAFSKAVSNPLYKELFRQSQDGGYFLSEEASIKVQGWTEGKPINAGDVKEK